MADSFDVTQRSNAAPFNDVVFQYDDSFEGLLTTVFESYTRKTPPTAVVGMQHQQLLGMKYEAIPTDDAKAERVIAGIERVIGGDAYERIWTGFLSGNPDKGNIIHQYLRLGMKLGPAVRRHITDERVIAMDKLASLVGRESSQLIEFVRFSKMEGNVYYARITPENQVLPLMMPHFADRFNIQPFIIHDAVRQLAGVYNTKEWFIVSTEDMQIPALSTDEINYRRLWKGFYDAVAIRERINPALRRQHMPKRFWRNITEMTMMGLSDTPDAKAVPLPSDISRAAVLKAAETSSPSILYAQK